MKYVQKRNILFLGDKQGSLHIYQLTDKKSSRIKLLMTQIIKGVGISCIEISKSHRYLFLGFEDKSLEVYDMGKNFTSKPSFVNVWEFSSVPRGLYFSSDSTSLIFSHHKGLLSFCDSESPKNYFTHFLHD